MREIEDLSRKEERTMHSVILLLGYDCWSHPWLVPLNYSFYNSTSLCSLQAQGFHCNCYEDYVGFYNFFLFFYFLRIQLIMNPLAVVSSSALSLKNTLASGWPLLSCYTTSDFSAGLICSLPKSFSSAAVLL